MAVATIAPMSEGLVPLRNRTVGKVTTWIDSIEVYIYIYADNALFAYLGLCSVAG